VSHSLGKVYQLDGVLVGYVEVNGTCEPPVCLPMIFTSADACSDMWRKQEWKVRECVTTEPCIILEDHGYEDGTWWRGKFCRKCMQVTEGHSPPEWLDEREKGLLPWKGKDWGGTK
jgi:hypothetical protein